MTYTEQLLDPRWKEKRRAVLHRDNHACIYCGSTQKLHVHHLCYTGFAWEAPDADLITLCLECHKQVHGIMDYGDFALVYKNYLRYVQQQASETLPTLVTLIYFNDAKNIVRATHEFIAEQSGVSIPTVARHMKRLRELRVVINDVMVPYACYLVHPLLTWKGKAVERDKYIKGLGADHPFMQVVKLVNEDPADWEETEE